MLYTHTYTLQCTVHRSLHSAASTRDDFSGIIFPLERPLSRPLSLRLKQSGPGSALGTGSALLGQSSLCEGCFPVPVASAGNLDKLCVSDTNVLFARGWH